MCYFSANIVQLEGHSVERTCSTTTKRPRAGPNGYVWAIDALRVSMMVYRAKFSRSTSDVMSYIGVQNLLLHVPDFFPFHMMSILKIAPKSRPQLLNYFVHALTSHREIASSSGCRGYLISYVYYCYYGYIILRRGAACLSAG